MKGLKIYLVSIYVVLIILLLLLSWCCRQASTVSDSPIPPAIEDNRGDEVSTPEKPLPPIKERFKADVIMCIDATGSMAGIINTVKSNALNFYSDIKKESRKHGKDITAMRIKVIAFRDYNGAITKPVFEESDFYTLPDQESNFSSFVSKLQPLDGGDLPELGVDAIARAMISDWTSDKGVKKVIILWTDAETKPVSDSVHHGFKGIDDIASTWNNDFNPSSKIFLFTPNVPTWQSVESALHNSIRHNVTAGGGLSEIDYEEILKTISEDI